MYSSNSSPFYGVPGSKNWNMMQNRPQARPEEKKPPNLSTDTGNVQSSIFDMMPKGWESLEPMLGIGYGKASELAGEENRRIDEARRMIAQQLARSNQMSMGLTQSEIDMRLGRASDAASESMLQNASSARSMLGQTGVIGGTQAAALEGAMRMGRMRDIQSSRTGLAIEEAARRAQAANDMFSRTAQAGAFMSQGPSMLELDQLNSITDVGLNAFLGEKQAQAARASARSNKKGSVISSVAGLLPFPKLG